MNSRGAAGSYFGVGTVQGHREIGLLCADRQRVAEIGPLESAHVLDLEQILAVGRRGEEQARVLAELAVGIVVVFIIEREDRQSVGDELGSRRMRLDDVARLAECVGQRRRIEIAPALAPARIADKAGIGPAGNSQNFTTSPLAYR